MSKRLILILVCAFVVGIAFTAYAEVQNVKVGGDITIYGIARNNLDLAKSPASGASVDGMMMTNANSFDDKEAFLAEIMRVRVSADLTDNVSVTSGFVSERNMNGNTSYAGQRSTNVGLTTATASENVISIAVGYVTMKEFLYSPLTIMVGRQALRFGNAWIVGDPDTNGVSVGNLSAGDLSALKGFDAIRAILDYDPLTVDVIYAKVSEALANRNDDITLSGLNAKYALNKETNLEGFFFSKSRGSQSTAVTNVDTGNATSFTNTAANNFPRDRADKVHTVGVRVVNKTVNNLTVDASGAFQFGTYNPKYDVNARWTSATNKAQTARRFALGAELLATYNLKDIAAISKYHPMLSGAFVYLSGEHRDKTDDKKFRGWDPMFEDQTLGHLINAMFGFSNIKLGGLSAAAKPTEDTSVKLDYVAAWFDKNMPEGRLVNLSGVTGARTFVMKNKAFVGQELDLNLTYDYTEDVQFSLLGGVFFTGSAFGQRAEVGNNVPKKANATELIGSMKVTF